MKIGYARVSTDEQNLGLQLDALNADGCGRVFEDTASGASSNKGLAAALDACASPSHHGRTRMIVRPGVAW
jgi:DNA invertase Pin-like site-specific DNA recombinase